MGHKLISPLNAVQPYTSAHSLLSQVSHESVVGFFQVANSYFLILTMSALESSTRNGNCSSLLSCDFVAGLFEKNNQNYLIVEADQPTFQVFSRPDIASASSAEPEATEASDHSQLALVQSLTDRELQIATLIAQGWSNKQAATHLAISEWTVATHLRRIFMKLQVDSRAAMVYKCAGLIQQLSNGLSP